MADGMVTPKKWSDFRKTGLLFLINSLLHAFGWAIVVKVDENGAVENCYPARVKFRGFDDKSQDEEHSKIAKYLGEHGEELNKEVNDV